MAGRGFGVKRAATGVRRLWGPLEDRRVFLIVVIVLMLGTAAATDWRATQYRSDQASAAALRDAPACSTPPPKDQSDCLLDIPVTVNRIWSESSGRRSTSTFYYVAVTGAAPANGTIEMADSSALNAEYDLGGSADALVWRGHVVWLSVLNEDMPTNSLPAIVVDRDVNWLVVVSAWFLLLLLSLVTRFTRLALSPWRYAIGIPGLAAVTATLGAVAGQDPDMYPHGGLYTAALFFAILSAIYTGVAVRMYRNGRLI